MIRRSVCRWYMNAVACNIFLLAFAGQLLTWEGV